MTLTLTMAGMNVLLRAHAGETINFTKAVLGNDAQPLATVTEMGNAMLEVKIASIETNGSNALLKTNFDNSLVNTGFRVTEIGIFCADLDDESRNVLYAYGTEPNESADYIAPASGNVQSTQIDFAVFVGAAENVTAVINQSLVYATKSEFDDHAANNNNPHGVTKTQVGLGNVPNVSTNDQTPTFSVPNDLSSFASGEKLSSMLAKTSKAISLFLLHKSNKDNPHSVTKAQIGLDNVPNVSTNDQTPTFSEASSLTELKSGEKVSTLFGKIAKAVSSLMQHIKNKDNPHTVTLSQVGAAASSHKHNASDISSGTLPVSRGGTGRSTLTSNCVIYAASENTIGQVALPKTDGMILMQNPSGAPCWGEACEEGSYTGLGRTGSASPNTITFTMRLPKIIFIMKKETLSSVTAAWGIILTTGVTPVGLSFVGSETPAILNVSINGKTVSWYYDSNSSHPASQLDGIDWTYYYVGI